MLYISKEMAFYFMGIRAQKIMLESGHYENKRIACNL